MAVIREQRQFSIGPIGVARASQGGAIVGEAIARSADQLAGMFFEAGSKQAQKRGEETALSLARESVITINPKTGSPEAYQPPTGFGTIATEAYQRVVLRRFQESIDDEMQVKAKELAVQYEQNPNGVALYESSMSDYIAEMSNVADGQFKAYIKDTGTAYLQATRASLSAAQIRRERESFAKAQASAVSRGMDDIEAIIAQQGPEVLSGPTQVNALINSIGVTVDDGVKAGLFDGTADTNFNSQRSLSVAKGLVRYASMQTDDPEVLEMLQHAIGTQNPNAVPAGFEYVADALRGMGSNFGALSDLEQVSDGLFSDRIQYANVIRTRELRAQEAASAQSIFDLNQDLPAAQYNARMLAMNSIYTPSGVVSRVRSEFSNLTDQARAMASTDKAMSDALLSKRNGVVSSTAEGLYLRALDGLSQSDANKLEEALTTGDLLKAPESARPVLVALAQMDRELGTNTREDFLPFIGSYRDGAGRAVDARLEADAEAQLSIYENNILNIGYLKISEIDEFVGDITTKVSNIENLNANLKSSTVREINFQASKAYLSEFFNAVPTEAAMSEAASYLQGGGATQELSEPQRLLLDKAREYVAESGKQEELRTQFNIWSATGRDRITRRQKADNDFRTLQQIGSGLGDARNPEHRLALEKSVEATFQNALAGRTLASIWTNPNSLSDDNLRPIFNQIGKLNVMPESLHNAFTSVARGGFAGGDVSAVLSHYANYKDYTYGTTTLRNPMMDALTESEIATLDYLTDSVRVIGGGPEQIAEIYRQRSEIESNPALKQRVETFFDAKLEDFVLGLKNLDQAPPSAYNAMSAAALSLYSVSRAEGLSRGEIKDRLERQIERSYPSGNGIVFGANQSPRTVASISKFAPNNEDLFINHALTEISKAMPDLQPRFDLDGILAAAGTRISIYAGEPVGNDVVYLQPIGVPTNGNVRYIVKLRKPLEEGGDITIMKNFRADAAGNMVRAPLILSNQDPAFVRKVNSRSAREVDEAMQEALIILSRKKQPVRKTSAEQRARLIATP
jgi:hypothetical protein